jgi:hypothetical protein
MRLFLHQPISLIHYYTKCICLLCFILLPFACFAGNITIKGVVKDVKGNALQGAHVIFKNNVTTYLATSNADGSYQITIPYTGIDEANQELRTASNYPNPFSDRTVIPVKIIKQGTILFSVYNLMGQKLHEISYSNLAPGEYYLEWDGNDQNGNSLAPGAYIYVLNFNGKQYSGKAIKAGYGHNYAGTSFSWEDGNHLKNALIDSTRTFLADVSLSGYYKSTRDGVEVKRDTTINFTLAPFLNVPFKTQGNSIAYWNNSTYVPLFIKGINLGSSPPGYWPGEIGYAISAQQYENWINRIGQMGFNSIRIYTLHPPVFYQKLANYNELHPDKPIYLFQGIWLEEVASETVSEYNLYDRASQFETEIESVIRSVHGDLNIPKRIGKAYGNYKTDMSRWIMGYVIGREMSAEEIDTTNKYNPNITSYSGTRVSITGVTPIDAWITARVDKVINFENSNYGNQRPVTFSSWPTLDPITHPTEIGTEEDIASFDLNNINLFNAPAGYFASYHAYPYFPNFVNDDPGYHTYSDADGPNPYLGYITDLKNHYNKIPLIIGEFGVPSSWGSAHQAYSGMHHGGLSEEKQGEYDVRLFKNIYEANCAGGFLFSWMDEWFKPTWIVQYQESLGFMAGSIFISTRQLWLNLCSPEQNFGLISFDQSDPLLYTSYQLDKSDGFAADIKASSDDRFLYLEIDLSSDINPVDTLWVAFDTYRNDLGESILPNKLTLKNRSEFTLQVPFDSDTAFLYVTQKYNNYGLNRRFNISDTSIQKFRSLPTDGEPWNLMQWRNDLSPDGVQNIGKIHMVNTSTIVSATSLTGVFLEKRKVTVRIPWTMLYFSDPTRLEVINGFDISKWPFTPIRTISDGIAISIAKGTQVINTTNRYTWPTWLVVHPTIEREKASLKIVEDGLLKISDTPK